MAGENYRGIWVYAEQQEGRLEPAVFEILAKAKQLSAHSGEEVTAVLLGDKVEPLAAELFARGADAVIPVSYTHLDVYKRQGRGGAAVPSPSAASP